MQLGRLGRAEIVRPLRQVAAEVDLAEERPDRRRAVLRRVRIDRLAERLEVAVHVRVRAVVDVLLALVGRDRLVAGVRIRLRWVVAEAGVLGDVDGRVDPEAVDAAVHPEAERVEERGAECG